MERTARTPEQLALALKEYRTLRDWNQHQTGVPVGLKQATVSVLENRPGASRIDTLFKLLSSLDLELVVRPRGARQNAAGTSGSEW